jgi:hypothetical protein
MDKRYGSTDDDDDDDDDNDGMQCRKNSTS